MRPTTKAFDDHGAVLSYPPLPPDRQDELFWMVRVPYCFVAAPEPGSVASAAEARDALIRHNSRLASAAARAGRRRFWFVPPGDMLGYAILGLIEAVDRFDPSLGNKFSSLAVVWVRRRLSRFVMEDWPLIGVPEKVQREVYKADAAGSEGDGKVRDAARALAREAADPEWESLQAGSRDDDADRRDAAAAVRRAVLVLDERSAAVVRLRNGFDGPPLDAAEVGRRYGLTANRVRQVEMLARRKMAYRLEAFRPEGSPAPESRAVAEEQGRERAVAARARKRKAVRA